MIANSEEAKLVYNNNEFAEQVSKTFEVYSRERFNGSY